MMILAEIVLMNVLQLVSVVKLETIQHEFKVIRNQDINLTIGESSLVSSVYKPSRMTCMASCNSNPKCLTAVYDNSQGRITNCFFYNRYFKVNELIPSSTTILYEKKTLPAYLNLFTDGTDTKIFNNSYPSITQCWNLEAAIINNTQYSLDVEGPIGVYLYDSNWNYQSTFNMPSIFYGIVADGFYYFTTNSGYSYGIIKTSLSSPAVINSYGQTGKYRGLYYDSSNSSIIAAGCDVSRVDFLDLNLKLINSVSLRNNPHGIAVYNSKIYVAQWTNGNVAVISNGTVVQRYPTKCSASLARITVDSFGYFALSCYGNGNAYLYDSNMQYANISKAFNGIWDARFDTNNRLGICTNKNVFIYN